MQAWVSALQGSSSEAIGSYNTSSRRNAARTPRERASQPHPLDVRRVLWHPRGQRGLADLTNQTTGLPQSGRVRVDAHISRGYVRQDEQTPYTMYLSTPDLRSSQFDRHRFIVGSYEDLRSSDHLSRLRQQKGCFLADSF
jgi:hypothetical protein